MTLNETMDDLNHLLTSLVKDLTKAHRGNKRASQRVRVGTIKLEKIGKVFRKESLLAEKIGKIKAKSLKRKRKKRQTARK